MDNRRIAFKLSQEHPQTVAVALSRLEPGQAGEIVSLLPQALQVDVVARIAKVHQLPPEVLEEIDEFVSALLKA